MNSNPSTSTKFSGKQEAKVVDILTFIVITTTKGEVVRSRDNKS